MRQIGVLKTEQQTYKVTKQERGKRATSKPRYPAKIYEKNPEGGWEFLESFDAKKPHKKNRMKSDSDVWQDAIERIRFYDESEIVDERTQFKR